MPRKVDANQREIVEKLRKRGISVQCLHTVGKGCPDILCGYFDRNYLFEIKANEKSKLTADEMKWHMAWQGQVHVILSAQEALDIIGVE